MGLFDGLRKALRKTAGAFAEGLKRAIPVGRRMDAGTLDGIEESLISTDMGLKLASRLKSEVEFRYRRREIRDPRAIIGAIKDELKRMLPGKETSPITAPSPPTVVLVVGVNGTGKTTSIAKLAKTCKDEGKKVLLAAADTFRAAAGAQLEVWAERVGVGIVSHGQGGDAGAVVHDACDAALARGCDYLIIDTAGRFHNKANLMRELGKIGRVASRKIAGAPHETLLVLDATTGQNAVAQARAFTEDVGVTGLFLAKLDGTAKGGAVAAIWNDVGVPVKYVGTGETADDVSPFDPETFVEALFA